VEIQRTNSSSGLFFKIAVGRPKDYRGMGSITMGHMHILLAEPGVHRPPTPLQS
jgi:hypothetical protein